MSKQPDALAAFLERFRPTERQRAILFSMMEGRTNKQIALDMGLKPKTISNYTRAIRGFARELGYEFLPKKGSAGFRLAKVVQSRLVGWQSENDA